MKLIVCGVNDANKILNNKDHGISAAISILDPMAEEFRRPVGLDTVDNVLEIQFHDVERLHDIYIAPTMEDAQTIVDFIYSTKAKIGNGSWLIHCHQGISRSTACGLLLCALTYGIDRAKEELLKVAPRASPNTLLCEYFDIICGFNGRLIATANDFDYQMLKRLAQGYYDTE